MRKRDTVLITLGVICTLISIYQLIGLELASFYTMFSVGMTLTLSCAYNAFSDRRLFSGWRFGKIAWFWLLMILVSIAIDIVGIWAGYWEYPHYGRTDQVRKYIFEWAVALFYHFVALVIGAEIFKKAGIRPRRALIYSLLTFVTAIGFLTESLNLVVHSWKVTSMPLTNLQFGRYFLVFQTIGYWLMAAIPFVIYQVVDGVAGKKYQEQLR